MLLDFNNFKKEGRKVERKKKKKIIWASRQKI